MATLNEKLASSLEVLRAIQLAGTKVVHASAQPMLTRTHLERLVRGGFLKPIIRDWYRFSSPAERDGDTTSWFAAADAFVAAYANERFDERWQLGAEQSLALQSGATSAMRQVIIQAPGANNQPLALPHDTSVFLLRTPEEQLDSRPTVNQNGLRLQSLEMALTRVSPGFFHQQREAAHIALRRADETELMRLVLETGATTIAGRLVGGLTAVGRDDDAQQMRLAMQAAGHDLRPANPFDVPLPELGGSRAESPYAQRVRVMWAAMRGDVLDAFKGVTAGASVDAAQLMSDVRERYVADAYNSLSIEGYRVDEALIERVRSGAWSPDFTEEDKQSRDALAAKGYAVAFKEVLEDVGRTVGEQLAPGTVFKRALAKWHLGLFSSSVQAGIIKASDLAGYRNRPVFIVNALHVPPPHEALRDCMPTLVELLEGEQEPAVRAVLGHFVFVFIHPYIDGNGRLGRFVMNYMLTTGGFVWTIVPVKRRAEYMAALEQASSHLNIKPFAAFIAELVTEQTLHPLTRAEGGGR